MVKEKKKRLQSIYVYLSHCRHRMLQVASFLIVLILILMVYS